MACGLTSYSKVYDFCCMYSVLHTFMLKITVSFEIIMTGGSFSVQNEHFWVCKPSAKDPFFLEFVSLF